MSNSSDANGGAENAQKCCKICGDSAGCGINFGCFSCESCKAFFRRCSVRAQSLKCPFNGHCRITKVSRRACQSCRLYTCVKNGMRKELVDVWKKVRAVSPVEGGGEEGIGIGEHVGQKQRQSRRKVRKVCGCCGCKCEEGKQTAEKGTQTDVQRTKDAVLDEESFSTLSPSSPTLSRPLEDVHQLLLDVRFVFFAIYFDFDQPKELIRANGVLDAPLRVPHQHVLPFNL
uniref:Nuclear receptor domain-containing protein n=1 Tax=Globodera pallida TaxID=36090 RepID=A0A183C1P3_GLOPA